MSNTGYAVVNTGTVETFSLHLYSENINSSSVERRKLSLAATNELSKEERISISIENSHNAKNHLETLSSKCSWGLLISKVPDTNGVEKVLIKNYKNVPCDNTLACNNTHLGSGLNQAPVASKIMQNLDLRNNTTHCTMFYNRVRSKMIAQTLEGHYDQTS